MKASSATAAVKDKEISQLRLALQTSQEKEKASQTELAVMDARRRTNIGFWLESDLEVNKLRARVATLEAKLERAGPDDAAPGLREQLAAAEDERKTLKKEVASLEKERVQVKVEKDTLQQRTSRVQGEHKALANKFTDYKVRMRSTSNENCVDSRVANVVSTPWKGIQHSKHSGAGVCIV